MRDIPQFPRLIRMVLFFYPCNNGPILLKVLPALSTLEQPLGASFSSHSDHMTGKQ